MADKTKEKAKAKRIIKDAGQRLVFGALEMDSQLIAQMLAESMLPAGADKTKIEAKAKQVLKLLPVEDGGGVSVWVQLGGIVEHSPTKPEAVAKAVDKPLGSETPGRFRAPTRTAWRGEEQRRVPTQVALEVEVVD